MQINKLLDKMRSTLLLAGVPKHQINVRGAKTQKLADAFDWLHNLKMGHEYCNYVLIRALLPEATWERYSLFGIDGLKEQILLTQAAKALRAKWREKRPAVFNSEKKVKHENY